MMAILRVVAQAIAIGLLVIYALGVIVNLLVAISATIWPAIIRPGQHKLNIVLKAAAGQRSLPLRAIALLVSSAAWPVLTGVGRRVSGRKNDLEFAARLSLRPMDRPIAVFNIGLVAAILGALELNLLPRAVPTIVAALVSTAIALRHVSYLFGSLAERLRRSQLNAQVAFAEIVASDVVALVGCVAILRVSNAHVVIGDLESAAFDLFSFHQITDLASMSPSKAWAAGLGVLAYAVLIKSLVTFAEFQRKDDDYRHLAFSLVAIGKYKDARAWINKESDPNRVSFDIRAEIELGLGKFDNAKAQVSKGLVVRGERDDIDIEVMRLQGLSLMVPMASEARLQLIVAGLAWGASDVQVSIAVDGAIAKELIPTDALVTTLMETCTEERYPLTRAVLFLVQRNYAAATDLLTKTKLQSDLGELLRLIYLLIARLGGQSEDSSPEGVQAFVRAWLRESLPELKLISGRLGDDSRVPGGNALVTLWRLVELIDEESADEVKRLASELADTTEEFDQWVQVNKGLLPA